ncbi:alanine racemase [PVC group bacterium]|nr:alanine racemase [PVC group bacterium]
MSVNTWVEINLNAIVHNFHEIKNYVGRDVCVLPVVKSDAYGHGACEIARILAKEGVSFFAVNNVEEGIAIRNLGHFGEILVMGGLLTDDLDSLLEYNLIPTVHSIDWARHLSDKASKRRQIIKIHIKIDTGMGRLGINCDEAKDVLKEIVEMPYLKIDGVYTHFSTADEVDRSFLFEQIKRFEKILKNVPMGKNIFTHVCNSAAMLDFPACHYNMVRPGLALYGYVPSERIKNQLNLIPAMSYKSRVLVIKDVLPEKDISYGQTFRTKRRTKIGIIPVGYGLGYFRCLSNKGYALIHSRKAPVIGRVCMDQIVLDLTDIPAAAVGDEVVLMGTQGGCEISAHTMAKWTGTISYEILCSLGRNIPRLYLWREERQGHVDIYERIDERRERKYIREHLPIDNSVNLPKSE